jgi:hypothetical protein
MSRNAAQTEAKRIWDVLKWVSAFIFVLLLLTSYFLYRLAATFEDSYAGMPPVEAACVMARLNPPPGNVIRAESHVLLAGDAHVQFQADRAQIEAWLRNSPGIKDLKPSETYSSNHELKFVDDDAWLKENSDSERLDVEAIQPDTKWFAPRIKNGVRYEVPPDEAYDRGSIFIDWDTNTVWIWASHS